MNDTRHLLDWANGRGRADTTIDPPTPPSPEDLTLNLTTTAGHIVAAIQERDLAAQETDRVWPVQAANGRLRLLLDLWCDLTGVQDREAAISLAARIATAPQSYTAAVVPL